MAATDPGTALAHWRAGRERLFREHPQSPVPAEARAHFRALHFDHDPLLRFHAVVEPAPPPEPGALPLELPNSVADSLSFSRIGRVRLPFPDGERTLSVFWMAGYAGGIFIPFRDATNGETTYGAGRYLVDGAKGADLGAAPAPEPSDGALILDFKFAFQPSGFRPSLGVPARAARESPRPGRSRRRTADLRHRRGQAGSGACRPVPANEGTGHPHDPRHGFRETTLRA